MSARAYITAISFPSTFEDVLDMLSRNAGLFDVELVERLHELPQGWSAPRWARAGDVVFFYCTKNWPAKIVEIRRATLDNPSWRLADGPPTKQIRADLDECLGSAEKIHEEIGGTIFAVGRIKKDAERQYNGEDFWLRDRHFAPIHKISIGKNISKVDIDKHVRLTRQGTITTLNAETARVFIDMIFDLIPPSWLQKTTFWHESSKMKYGTHWKALVTSDEFRPINEAELRELFVDPFLKVFADEYVWPECRCISTRGRRLGVADYIIRIDGKLVVVETKLRIDELAPPISQIQRYLKAEYPRDQKGW